MEALNLLQGSSEWHEHRASHLNASDAPAMMGVSKYVTRDELLRRYKTGEAKPIDAATQRIFDDGHKYEAMARPVAEKVIGEELFPVTGSKMIYGLALSASFDGLTIFEDVNFEHKSINENLRNTASVDDLDEMYKVQMDQQMLVSGAEKTLFMASNGTEDDMVQFWYEKSPGRQTAIIDGWKQFEKDLASYELPISKPVAVANEVERFPVVKFEVAGTDLTSNINECLATIKDRSQIEMSRELETDQDFADKEELNKATKQARADLQFLVKSAQNKFVSFSEFATVAAELDSVLQKMQSHGEKLVKSEKDARKAEIAKAAIGAFTDHCADLESELVDLSLPQAITHVNFHEPMKGKRTIESLSNAVNTRLAEAKIAADGAAKGMRTNLTTLKALTNGEYDHLFKDLPVVIHKERDDFEALVTLRVSQEKERIAEAAREEQERIEAEAQKKAEQEAAAKKEAGQSDAPAEIAPDTVEQAMGEQPETVQPPAQESVQRAHAQTGFDGWWDQTGQHLARKDRESMGVFVERVARAAWNVASGDPF